MSVERSSLGVDRAAPRGAVFLSYASQDAAAARSICDALRAAGVEVWFDQNELVGGDAWDAKIRKQIAECALFVPVISAATQARLEGYFRLEWKLAAQRTHLMAEAKPFLLPVVIDATRDGEAHVPEEFRNVQWTRLPGAEPSGKFCARVRSLLSGGAVLSPAPAIPEIELRPRAAPERRHRTPLSAWIAVTAVALGALYFALRPGRNEATTTPPTAVASPHGVAGDKSGPPLSEARKLAAKADSLFDRREDASRRTLELAETFCRQAIALDPNDGEIRAIYARLLALFIAGSFDSSPERLESAKVQAELAVKLAPESFETRLALANYFRSQSVTIAEGIRQLRQLVAEQPNHQRAVRTLGNALRLAGTSEAREESLIHYDRADALGGGDPLACYGKYLALFSLGRDPEAEAALDRAIALQRCGKYLSRKAALAIHRGDLKTAADTVQQIPAPELLEAEYAYFAAWVWLWSEEPQRALEVWKGIPSGYAEGSYFTGPTDYLSGLALHLLGREQAAIAAWRAALQQVEKRIAEQPASRVLTGWKAVLLARLGRTQEVVDLISSYWQMPGRSGSHHLAALNYRVLAAELRMYHAEPGPERLAFLRARTREFPVAAIVLRHDPEFSDLRAEPVFRRLVSEFAPAVEPPRLAPRVQAKSIAVLAFKNLSDDRSQEYFSDGLSEELSNALGRVPGLFVLGSTSAFSVKGQALAVPEIARKLGVAYVVEGTVRPAGPSVRVSARLLSGADGLQVWSSGNLDREVRNSLALQEELAGLIAQQLSLKLGAAPAAAVAAVDPEAYRLYLEGLRAWSRRSGVAGEDEELLRAQGLFGRALALAPDFARAQAAFADTWVMLFDGRYRNFAPDAAELGQRARREVDRALVLGADLGEVQATHARLLLAEQRYEEAAAAFQRAIRVNPNYAYARQWYGRLLCNRGRLEEGLAEMQVATQLDPLSPIVTSNYALYLSMARRWAEVLPATDRVLALAPDYRQAVVARAQALVSLSRVEEARALLRAEATRGQTLAGNSRNLTSRLLAGERGELVPEAEARLAKPDALRLTDAVRLALALGRTEDAFRFARERPRDWRVDSALSFFYPGYDDVRADPRFRQWLEDAGCRREYEQAWAEHEAWRRRTGAP